MKKLLTLFLAFVSIDAFSQLYVTGSTNYVYVKGTVVFVKQDINLQANTNFYLRNEGQLVQGTTSTSANKGAGKVSVFQEGTVNNYAYNYWCSPVGNASAATGNESFGITMLGSPTSVTATTAAANIGSFDGFASPLTISNRWIYKFLSSTVYSDWIYVGSTSTIGAGEGFTMKGTSGTDSTIIEGNSVQNNSGSAQRYDFRGKPNDGNITVNTAPDKFTLTGNPYPSALNVNAFLLDAGNSAMVANAYYWEQDKTVNSHYVAQYVGGYGTYSPVSLGSNGVYVPATFNTYNGDGSLNANGATSNTNTSILRKYAPVGQGFMIYGAPTGSSVTLKNSHRAYYKESTSPNSYFARNASAVTTAVTDNADEIISHLRFNISINNQFTRQIALILIPSATDGVDNGIDALSPDGDLPNDTYFFLNDNRYVIEGVAFDVSKRIPLGLKVTENTSFKFSLLESVNFDTAQNIYIYDGLDNSYHDIKNGNYEVMLSTGVYNNRFEITFTNVALGVNQNTADNLLVVQDNSLHMLRISNPDAQNLAIMALYDISGRQVFSKQKLGTEAAFEFPTVALSEGVYLVKLTTDDNKVLTQKIIIKK